MRNGQRPLAIGVFGHYGNRNLGDEAIITAVIQNIRARVPDAHIVGFSIVPADTSARYGIPAYPIRQLPQPKPARAGADAPASTPPPAPRYGKFISRFASLRWLAGAAKQLLALPRAGIAELRFLRQSRRRLRGLDLLLITGSNQFLDNFGGPGGFPFTLLKWSVLARLAGTKLAFVSVGAGPIDALSSRMMVRVAIRLAHYLSYRDVHSRHLIEIRGLTPRGQVFPDLAYSLDFDTPAASGPRKGSPVVGINPMPMYDSRYWCEPDARRYADYVRRLAGFVERVLRDGYDVFFFATQPKDENVIADLRARLDARAFAGRAPGDVVRRTDSVAGLMRVIGSADFIVATRYHGTVLATLAERPTLSICYYRKTRDVRKECGHEVFAVDLDTFDPADLARRLETLRGASAEVVRADRARNRRYRAALARQYDRILAVAGMDVAGDVVLKQGRDEASARVAPEVTLAAMGDEDAGAAPV